jgi:aminopeptidase N
LLTDRVIDWGLVTYRTTGVLFDESLSAAKYKNRVTYLVAHELAHQWFGNLVTMDWWSELWLNEGFATWAGWLATDHLYPDWEVWPQFVTEEMQTAFRLDSLRSSHPIEVQVKDALDVGQIFDDISYSKGSSLIRMLAAHLGLDTFLAGVSKYLKSHAFGNTTTNDLWSALSRESGQDVGALMDPWTRKIGFPVLTIAEELSHVGVSQARYLSTGDVRPEDDKTIWWVPLLMKGEEGVNGVESNALARKEDTIESVDKTFYKINDNNTGFYRTNYSQARLASFGKQLEKLTASDKIGLIGDTGSLAYSGNAKTPALLGFLEGFSAEENQLVWSQIISSLGTVKSVFSEITPISQALRVFTLKLIDTAVRKIGWEFAPNEDYLTGQLRALLINSAGLNGNDSVITEGRKRFQDYTRGKNDAIHPSLRLAVFNIAVRYGGSAEYEAVKKEWSTALSFDGKEIALSSLAQIQDITLLPDFLKFIFNSAATQDMHIAAAALAANSKTRAGLWEYIKKNWEMVREKLGGKMTVLDRFLKSSLVEFTDLETEEDIAEFFNGKDNRGYDRTLRVTSDIIKGRAAYREREKDTLLVWLETNGYA